MNREKIPQGYEIHEIPPDYFGPLFLEGQMRAVIAAEREACAKVCEETTASWTQYDYNEACMECARSIRRRGQK